MTPWRHEPVGSVVPEIVLPITATAQHRDPDVALELARRRAGVATLWWRPVLLLEPAPFRAVTTSAFLAVATSRPNDLYWSGQQVVARRPHGHAYAVAWWRDDTTGWIETAEAATLDTAVLRVSKALDRWVGRPVEPTVLSVAIPATLEPVGCVVGALVIGKAVVPAKKAAA